MNTSIVNIILNNKSFQLSCKQEEESELHQLATNLNHRISKLRISNPTASFELLLVMVALSLQEEVMNFKNQYPGIDVVERSKQMTESSEALNVIIESLENLANKLAR